MLRVCSLGSGSEGNALVVEARAGLFVTRVLIDNGFTVRQLERRLARAQLELSDIDAILVTHEHSDHVGGVAQLARHAGIEVYCTAGTARAAGLGAEERWQCIEAGRPLELGPLRLEPFAVPHDAAEPVQYVFSDGDRRAALLTDSGEGSDIIRTALAGMHALLLECNHDSALLRSGPYPEFLKERIGGARGHLSNAQAASLLATIDRRRLGWIAAAHLSRSNNTPSLAKAALAAVLNCPFDEVAVLDQDSGLAWRAV